MQDVDLEIEIDTDGVPMDFTWDTVKAEDTLVQFRRLLAETGADPVIGVFTMIQAVEHMVEEPAAFAIIKVAANMANIMMHNARAREELAAQGIEVHSGNANGQRPSASE